MSALRTTTVKSLLVPGGVFLVVGAGVLHSGFLTLTLPGLTFVFYATLTAGLVLAWRFHSSRVFFALLVLLVAQHAVQYFGMGRTASPSILELVGFLLPLDFALISLTRERGFTMSSVPAPAFVLFAQSIVAAVLLQAPEASPLHRAHHASGSAGFPIYVWASFASVAILLLARFFLVRKPSESALLWSQTAFFLGLIFGGVGRLAIGYFTLSALILAASIIETSYALAYRDELTSLPSRRAFNDALQRLQPPYTLAAVDIDHFKRFNDTYGHETGDEVLRLVASKLARVGGGGCAYRCGGEEFVILFPGGTTKEVIDHVEQLRSVIEASSFRLRRAERRQQPRGAERRNPPPRGRARAPRAMRQLALGQSSPQLSVTVSIGVAASSAHQTDPVRILQMADKALYCAKDAGRNRVEIASPRRSRIRTAGIA